MALKIYNTPQEVKNIIQAELPSDVVFKKPGKGDLDYISITFVMDVLNAAFGQFGWNVEVLDKWIQESIPYFQKNDRYNTAPEANATVNEKGEPGQYIPQNPVAWVTIRLTVKMYDEDTREVITVVKESSGSKIVNGKAGEQEHIFKSAQSDAIKKAAAMLGIGLELARKEPEKEYFEELNSEPLPIIWDEAMQSKHAVEWNAIVELCEEQQWEMDQLAYYVELATDGAIGDIFYMPEESMTNLIETLINEGLVSCDIYEVEEGEEA